MYYRYIHQAPQGTNILSLEYNVVMEQGTRALRSISGRVTLPVVFLVPQPERLYCRRTGNSNIISPPCGWYVPADQ